MWLYDSVFVKGHKNNRYKSTLSIPNAGSSVLLYAYQIPHPLVRYKLKRRGGVQEGELLTTYGNQLHICTSHLLVCICWHWMLCNLRGCKLILYLDHKHYCGRTLLEPKLRSSVKCSMYLWLKNEKYEWQNMVNLSPLMTYLQIWWWNKLGFPGLRPRHCLYHFTSKNALLQGVYSQEVLSSIIN